MFFFVFFFLPLDFFISSLIAARLNVSSHLFLVNLIRLISFSWIFASVPVVLDSNERLQSTNGSRDKILE